MLDLLARFSVIEIIAYGVILMGIIKGTWDLLDFFNNKYSVKFNKDYNEKKQKEMLESRYQNCAIQHEETVKLYNELGGKIDDLTGTVTKRFNEFESRLDQLNNNDKHTIKQSLVKDYHHFDCFIDFDNCRLLYRDLFPPH